MPIGGNKLGSGVLGSGVLGGTGLEGVFDGWQPLSLYDGNGGFYFAESNPVARWQDAARTTLASPGDPLGGLTDLSGNGHHAGQSTAASRPALTGLGLAVYGAYDGTDDYMDVTIGSGVIRNTAGATFWGIAQDDLATIVKRLHLYFSRNAGNTFIKAEFGRVNTAGEHGLSVTVTPSAGSGTTALYNKGDQRNPTHWVVTVDCTANLMSVYINGSFNSSSSTTITDFEDLAEIKVRIGAYTSGVGDPTLLWNGKISHAGCIDRVIGADELTELNDWLAARKWT